MGRYIVCKSPVVRLDMMVKEEMHAQLVSYIMRTGCVYESEEKCNPGNGTKWVCLKGIEGPSGYSLGELIGLFYSLEWGNLIGGHEDKFYFIDKFYLILNTKKKGKKKHVREDRQETDTGCESGNTGESGVAAEPGPLAGYCGERSHAGAAGCDDPGEQPGMPSTCDGRCE